MTVLASAWKLATWWKGRIAFAAIDQFFSSASNFLFTIYIAHLLSIDSFGLFSVVWTISLLADVVTNSLVVDPLIALTGERRKSSGSATSSTESLRASAFWICLALSGATSLAIGVSGMVATAWSSELGGLLLCLAALHPLQRLHVLVRRLCYLEDRQHVAAITGGCFALTLLVAAALLVHTHQLSSITAMLTWTASSAVVVAIGYAFGIMPVRLIPLTMIVEDARTMMRSGRWLLPAASVYWISGYGVIPMMAAYAGPAAGGIIRALLNLFSPVYQANGAITWAVSHKFSDASAMSDPGRIRRLSVYGTIPPILVAAGYCAVVLIWPADLLNLIYGKPEIVAAAPLIWPLVIGLLIDAASQGSGLSLLAMGRTQAILAIRLASLVVFAALGLVLTPAFGIGGVIWAIVASITVVATLSILEMLRATRHMNGPKR
ncbi:MAG: hypothetical protein HC900_02260 [Methylacidiphilales bacterium]|nr:hypothetical protein [Candidatus Methylacidiphilales bacterium]